MFLKNNKYRGLIIALIISILVILILFKLIDNADIFINIIKKFISLSMSFIYGVVIAYVLTPIVKLFEKKAKLNRGLSIALTYAILIGSIALLALYAIPNLIDNIKEIGSNIPNYITSIEDMINKVIGQEEINSFINTTGANININTYVDKVGQIIIGALEGSVMKMVSLSSIIIQFIIGLLVAIYILMDKERLLFECKRLMYLILKKQKSDRIIEFIQTYNSMIVTYIGIKAIDSTIIGILAFVLLTIVNSEYALLLGKY